MPPKVKPVPARKTATKRESADVDEMPSPAPRVVVTFSVDSIDKYLVSYYCEGSHDYVDVVVHVNRVLRDGDYRVSITTDGKYVSWQRGVQSICFIKNILESILGDAYISSSHRAIAYDNIAQDMKVKKVLPKNKQFCGTPQMMRIK
jgi:hypothetical protein